MIQTLLRLLALSVLIDLIALGVFCLTDQQGVSGYGSVLLYCSMAVAMLGGLAVAGSSGPRRVGDAYLEHVLTDEETRLLNAADRRQGASFGLVLFLAALLSGVSGYLLARLASPSA